MKRLLLAALLASTQAQAAPYIVGDTFAEGVQEVTEYPGFTNRSATIRSTVGLLDQVPESAEVFVFVGLNDAASANPARVGNDLRMLLDMASIRHQRLTVIGPPCVYTHYDDAVDRVDKEMASIAASFGTPYISTRSGLWCNRRIRARDGVLLSYSGYLLLWDSIKRAADAPNLLRVFGKLAPVEPQ